MSKPKEDEEEDEEDKGKEPTQVTSGDNSGKEVVKIPAPEIPEAVKVSIGVSSTMTLQEAAAATESTEEFGTTSRE